MIKFSLEPESVAPSLPPELPDTVLLGIYKLNYISCYSHHICEINLKVEYKENLHNDEVQPKAYFKNLSWH